MSLSFKSKIRLLPLSAAVVFIIGMVVSFLVGNNTSAVLEQLRSVDYPYLEHVTESGQGVEQFRLTLQSAAAEGDDSKLKEVAQIATATKAVMAEIAKLKGKEASSSELQSAFEAYQVPALDATHAMLTKGDVGDQVQRMQKALVVLDGQITEKKKQATQVVADAQAFAASGVQRGLWIGLVTGAVVLAVLALASRLIFASVWHDLGEEPAVLREMVQHIADGDLSAKELLTQVGSPDSLRAAVVATADKLNTTVGKIRTAVDSIATASSEIATGNQYLSERTEHAASNLQQAAGAMEALTSTVTHSGDAAQQASKLAQTASGAAQRGGGIMSQVVTNMDEINVASHKISEIIGVIDGIAFQTNILALNAAVEAARAGEQGRGFAVVASEVRSLAQRSAEAAKEIKVLINVSSAKVESGSQLVHGAGSAMEDIVTGVQRVTNIIGEITATTSEQSSGIVRVNQSVSELDQMTQQNAALVEQAAAAADSLREQAGILAQSVSTFRLREGTVAVHRNSAVAPKRPVAPLRAAVPSQVKARVKPLALASKPKAVGTTAAAPSVTAKATSNEAGDWETF